MSSFFFFFFNTYKILGSPSSVDKDSGIPEHEAVSNGNLLTLAPDPRTFESSM
jgi:hypothetical protein